MAKPKEYSLVYVGNNWYRWRPLERVLRALESVREQVGRVALVGHGWGEPAPWAHPSVPQDAYRSDPEYLHRLGVELVPAVPFTEVLGWMSRGVCSPVIYRPMFDRLRLVTCRTFETPAADTVPLFEQEDAFVTEIYGPAATELRLGDDCRADKIIDVLRRPEHYAEVVQEVRRHLVAQHSYEARLRALIDLIKE